MRLDLFLYQKGYTDSRRKAQTLISNGQVYIDGRQIQKPSYDIDENGDVLPEIRGEVMPYVGRGGYKLERALDAFCVTPKGFRCADIGASTGGFTDCLLQRGAAHVFAVDSGRDQLAEKLRADERVTVMEQFNAKQLTQTDIGGVCDLCVCDVSFISITQLFAPISGLLCPYDPKTKCGSLLALIKPQFEAGREFIGKNGIIRDKKVYPRVLSSVIRCAAEQSLYCTGVIPSPILGGDGNREFLAHFAHGAPDEMNLSLCEKSVLCGIADAADKINHDEGR